MAQRSTPADPVSSDEFAKLLRRLRVLMSQLWLAGKNFSDLSTLPPEHVAAAVVVQEAAAELNDLYDRLLNWQLRHETPPPRSPEPRVSLVLKEYAPERKVNVIRVVREVLPGCSLTQAKALIERELPTRVVDGLARNQAESIITKFAAAGAICVWVETDPALN